MRQSNKKIITFSDVFSREILVKISQHIKVICWSVTSAASLSVSSFVCLQKILRWTALDTKFSGEKVLNILSREFHKKSLKNLNFLFSFSWFFFSIPTVGSFYGEKFQHQILTFHRDNKKSNSAISIWFLWQPDSDLKVTSMIDLWHDEALVKKSVP